MDRSPLVCVVIPTRDRASVAQAVESVLGQDVTDVEIVIVDDGSVVPVLQSLAVVDPRVTVIRNETPQGPAAARNQGAARSTAPFLGFLDDDDRWFPRKLRASLACMDEHPSAGLVEHRASGAGSPPAESTTGGCRLEDDAVRRMLVRQPPHLDAVLVRREVHEAVLFDESFHASEDLDYLLRAAMATPVVVMDDVLAEHGRGDEGRSFISYQSRVEGRRQFHAKHVQLFDDPEVVAFYELRLGHQCRLAGMRGDACRSFARAMRSRHVAWRACKGLAATALPSAVAARRTSPTDPSAR